MNPPSPSDEPSRWIRLARRLGIDHAVGFAVLSRLWQLLTGPVTQILIVWNFSTPRQDFYYAFGNLIGMQIFVELGLQVVLISIASHEWAGLRIGREGITGDPQALSRLTSLGRKMLTWYSIVALLFVTCILFFGLQFLSNATELRAARNGTTESVSWTAPWIIVVVLCGLQFPLIPVTAIAEGCHQLPVINRVRFLAGVAGTMTAWVMISSGAGLWTIIGTTVTRLLGEFILVFGPLRPFLNLFHSHSPGPQVNWRSEVLPLQWRIAIQGVLLWGVNQLPGLVLFSYHSEGEATRLGMTWTILTALQAASLAWIETRRPQFGSLIAARNYRELDRLFFRLSRLSILAMSTAACAFCVAVWWIGTREEALLVKLSARMLGLQPTLLFSLAMVIYQFALCTNLYVRAHKKDPFLAAAIISSLTIATLEVWLGRIMGGSGVALGYLLGISLVQVPLWTLIWWNSRRDWHRDSDALNNSDVLNNRNVLNNNPEAES